MSGEEKATEPSSSANQDDGEQREKPEDTESGIGSEAPPSQPEPKKLELENEEEKQKRDSGLLTEQKEEKLAAAKQLRQDGNEFFRTNRFEEAAVKYQQAAAECPFDESSEIAILYSNWAASLLQMSRYDDAVTCLNRAIVHDPNFVKSYLRRAKAYEHLDKLDEALEDYKKILELDPSVHEARRACMELPQKINERNERLKNEMMDKLKQLGNMVLRPFGLSTDSFELKQDAATGSYSIGMKK